MIAVLGNQRVAERVNARLDGLLAVVFHGIRKTNRAHERALGQLRINNTKSLRSVGLSRNGFA